VTARDICIIDKALESILEIRYSLQCAIVDLLHREMMLKGYSDMEGFQSLMREDSDLSYNRVRVQNRVEALKECLLLLPGLMG
jgi:hypothetical protein